jgi:hypothetical protein
MMVWGSSFSVGAAGLTVQGQLDAGSADITNNVSAGSVDTRRLVGDRLYAGDFAGSDADARLSNALSAATSGDVIYLESATYTQDITTTTNLTLIGTGVQFSGTQIDGTTTWTFDSPVNLSQVFIPSKNVSLQVNDDGSILRELNGFDSQAITVDSGFCRITSVSSLNVTLTSNSKRCVVDASSKVAVTDNGTLNVTGDIT